MQIYLWTSIFSSEVLIDHNIACMQILALCKVVPWIMENYVWKSIFEFLYNSYFPAWVDTKTGLLMTYCLLYMQGLIQKFHEGGFLGMSHNVHHIEMKMRRGWLAMHSIQPPGSASDMEALKDMTYQ